MRYKYLLISIELRALYVFFSIALTNLLSQNGCLVGSRVVIVVNCIGCIGFCIPCCDLSNYCKSLEIIV